MPLEIVDYDDIFGKPKKLRLPVGKNRYDEFGTKVVSILRENSQKKGLHECEYVSDLRRMQGLLGKDYELTFFNKGRGSFPKARLRQMLTIQKSACIIDGTYRYIRITEKESK